MYVPDQFTGFSIAGTSVLTLRVSPARSILRFTALEFTTQQFLPFHQHDRACFIIFFEAWGKVRRLGVKYS